MIVLYINVHGCNVKIPGPLSLNTFLSFSIFEIVTSIMYVFVNVRDVLDSAVGSMKTGNMYEIMNYRMLTLVNLCLPDH